MTKFEPTKHILKAVSISDGENDQPHNKSNFSCPNFIVAILIIISVFQPFSKATISWLFKLIDMSRRLFKWTTNNNYNAWKFYFMNVDKQ